MDPRWRDLPYTDTEFVPATYASRTDWEEERARLKEQVLFAAGLSPMPDKPPLNARIWNRIERDGYSMEKVYFQSLPNFYVGGTLFRPLDPTPGGHPGVLAPHGHARLGRLNESDDASYLARGLTLARIGCTAFMWDMVDYNDSARHLSGAYQDEDYGTVHRAFWQRVDGEQQLWNFSILGLQLWNAIRALDFVEGLPEVDPQRLVCTGESGGGTQTYNLYAVDDRLAAAAPVCMVSAYMQGGCLCENAPALRFDTNNVDIGATIAPKPLLLVSSAQDWTAHTPEVEYPAIRKIYDLYEAGYRVEEVQIDAPHGYNKEMREAVYRWLGRVCDLPVAADFREPAYEMEPRENLLAFFDGLPEGALTEHEALVAQQIAATRAQVVAHKPDTLAALKENRRVLGTALRAAVGYRASDAALENVCDGQWKGLAYQEGTLVCAQRGVRVPMRRFASPENDLSKATLLVHAQGMEALDPLVVRALLEAGQIVYTVDAFGTGTNIGSQDSERPRGSTAYFSTFNRSDDAERVGDIALALRHMLDGQSVQFSAAGFGSAGLWLLLAGALLEADARLRIAADVDGFVTDRVDDYLDRLPIPGILRGGGLPNAAALLVPHDVLMHCVGQGFDTSWAESAYRLYGEASLRIESDSVANDALVDFLDGRP